MSLPRTPSTQRPGRTLAGQCLMTAGLTVLVVAVATSLSASEAYSGLGWKEAATLAGGLALLASAALLLGARVVLPAGIAALLLLSFFYKLDVPSWNPDERIYSEAGLAYLRDGAFFVNVEHPPLAKYLLGLAQVVGGDGELLPVRLVAALASVAAGGFLFLLGRRAVGTRAGILAVVLFAALPTPVIVSGELVSPASVARFAILETVMAAFVAAALYAGWRWCESLDWRWALGAGLAIGLAGASKLPGLFVLVPVLALAVYTQPLSRVLAGQASVLVCAAAVVMVGSYLPMGGDASNVLRDMIDFQREHARAGHLVSVGNHVYAHPPWWANAYFQWHSMGALATVSLLALAAASLFVVTRRLVVYLAIAALTPFLYLSLVVPIALPHYFYLWLVPLVALAAAALDGLLGHARALARGAAVAAAIVLAFVGVRHLIDITTLEPSDYRVAARIIEDRDRDRGAAVVFGYPWVLEAYLPAVAASDPAREPLPLPRQANAVIIDPVFSRRVPPPPAVDAFLRRGAPGFVKLKAGRLDVYVRVAG